MFDDGGLISILRLRNSLGLISPLRLRSQFLNQISYRSKVCTNVKLLIYEILELRSRAAHTDFGLRERSPQRGWGDKGLMWPLIKSYIWGNQQHNGPNGSPNLLNMALSEVYFAIIKELRTKRTEIFWSGMGGQPLQRVYSPPPTYWATLQVCAKIKINTFIWDSSVVLLSPTCLNCF